MYLIISCRNDDRVKKGWNGSRWTEGTEGCGGRCVSCMRQVKKERTSRFWESKRGNECEVWEILMQYGWHWDVSVWYVREMFMVRVVVWDQWLERKWGELAMNGWQCFVATMESWGMRLDVFEDSYDRNGLIVRMSLVLYFWVKQEVFKTGGEMCERSDALEIGAEQKKLV